jgi:hypothetical protein
LTRHIVCCPPVGTIFHNTESFARRCSKVLKQIPAWNAQQRIPTQTSSTNGTHLLRECGFLWNTGQKRSENDPDTARSQSGFVVFVAGAPVFWRSKLETMIVLLTDESELIALSKAIRYIKSLSYLINKLHKRRLIEMQTPCILFRIFEDNAAGYQR